MDAELFALKKLNRVEIFRSSFIVLRNSAFSLNPALFTERVWAEFNRVVLGPNSSITEIYMVDLDVEEQEKLIQMIDNSKSMTKVRFSPFVASGRFNNFFEREKGTFYRS